MCKCMRTVHPFSTVIRLGFPNPRKKERKKVFTCDRCMHICIWTQPIFTCIYMYTCMYAHKSIYVYVCIHVYICICIYMYIYAYIYTNLHNVLIYMHTYTYCVWVLSSVCQVEVRSHSRNCKCIHLLQTWTQDYCTKHTRPYNKKNTQDPATKTHKTLQQKFKKNTQDPATKI